MTIAPQRPPRAAPTRPLMAAARAVANEQTVVLVLAARPPAQADPVGAGDPLDALVERVRPVAAHAVDSLQVAARLEADGVTDRGARVEYGFDDVFALAAEVYRRLPPTPPPAPPTPEVPGWRAGRRDISHGLLYLMPGALFPAVLAAVGRGPLVVVLVLTGGLGWAWSGGASWLAYRRLGASDPPGAARVLAWSVLLGLPAAGTLGLLLVIAGAAGGGAAGGEVAGGGVGSAAAGAGGVLALCCGQMAYQLASMLLVFYRREGLLAAALSPAVAAGGLYVLLGGPDRPVGWAGVGPLAGTSPGWTLPSALVLGAAAVLLALALGLRETVRAARSTGPGRRMRLARWLAGKVGAGGWAGVRADLPGLAWATAYAALSAAYLLHAQAPYLRGGLEIALTAVPLMAGMGVVEWRARRFTEQARAALGQARYPREFAALIRRLLAAGVGVSVGVVAALAVPLLAGLGQAGRFSAAAALMAGAHAVLAGAYFLGFLLAGQGRYGGLCATLLAAVVVHTGGSLVEPPGLGGLALADPGRADTVDTALFLGSAVLLLALWAGLSCRTAAQAWRFR